MNLYFAAAIGAAVSGAAFVAGSYIDRLRYKRRMIESADQITLARMRAESINHIAADKNGKLGATFDGQTYRNLDTGEVFTQLATLYLDPMRLQMDTMHKMLIAMKSGNTPPALPEPQGVELPERVPLRSLTESYSVHNLVLGVSAAGPVFADMEDLVHIAIGGSSGWGKSVFLRSIVYQLAKSVENVDLVLIDLEKATFSPFYQCDRLLYPIIDNENDTVGVFKEIRGEMDRRRELYEDHPGVDSLTRYNQVADERIDPFIVAIDEGTALLDDKRVEKNLRTLAIRARKFGIWFLFGGQDWKATSIDSTIKNQFMTTVQFKARSKPQSHALLSDACAADITVKGRAFAILPGREMVEIQAPIIGHQQIIDAMTGKGPRLEIPEATDDLTERVMRTWHEMDRPNITAVCRELFDGQGGGANWNRVKEIAYSTGLLE